MLQGAREGASDAEVESLHPTEWDLPPRVLSAAEDNLSASAPLRTGYPTRRNQTRGRLDEEGELRVYCHATVP